MIRGTKSPETMSNFEFQLFGKFILLSMSIDDNRWAAFVSGGPALDTLVSSRNRGYRQGHISPRRHFFSNIRQSSGFSGGRAAF